MVDNTRIRKVFFKSETAKFRRMDETPKRRFKSYRSEKKLKEEHLREQCFMKIPKEES